MSHPVWCALALGHEGPCWPTPPGTPERQARDLAILAARNAGETEAEVGARFGLHREVVRNIMTRAMAQRQARLDEGAPPKRSTGA